MEFFNIIKNILIKKKVVIVPEIGQFRLLYVPAKIVDDEIIPPGYTLEFNNKISFFNDDLVEDVFDCISGDYNEAKAVIEQGVKEIKKQVKEKQRLKIKDFGTFYLIDGRKDFRADKNLTTFNGIFDLPKYKINVKKELKTAVQEKKNISGAKDVLKNKRKQQNFKLIYFVLLFIFFLVIAFFVYQRVISQESNQTPVENRDQEKRKTLNNNTVARKLDSVINKKNALAPVNMSEIPDKYHDCSEFSLIAGSFRTYRNAKELEDKLLDKGYKPFIESGDDDLYRVILFRYSERDSALLMLNSIQREQGKNFVWLLSK